MKTIVSFIAPLTALFSKFYDLDRVLNACQSEMNKGTATEGTVKRGAVRGGISYKKDGTLGVKDMQWSETSKLDYTVKQTVPVELVKFNDALANLFSKVGQPSGELTLDIVPSYLREWLDGKFKLAPVEAGKALGVESAPKVKPGKGSRNGNGIHAVDTAVAPVA